MKKSTKWICGVGIGIAVVGALRYFHRKTAKGFINLALDRKEPVYQPKKRNRLMGSAIDSTVEERVKSESRLLEETPHETVRIQAADGVELVGHWFPCPDAERIIVAMHGWRSRWSFDFCLLSKFWFRNRCSVLFVEQRAQGASGGDYIGFGLTERHDCPEWLRFADELGEGKLPIYLTGISMGGTTVLMAAADALPKQVKGIISDCAFTSPQAIWKHVMEHNFHLPFGIYRAIAAEQYRRKLHVDYDSYSTVAALEKTEIPVLLIHGTDDHFVPVEMTYENYKACQSPKRILVVPGAEHGMSYWIEPERYEKEVLAFWEAFH